MSQTGQQHSKADTGGQRPPEPKSSDKPSPQGSTKEAIDAGKVSGGKDAKK